LLTYLRPYRLSFAVVVAGSLLDSALNAVIPLSFKFMIDRAVGGKTRYVLFLPLIVSFAVIIISLAGTGRDYMYSKICSRVMADIRYKIFEHLQRLSLDFYSRAQVGDILSHFSNDLSVIDTALIALVSWGVLPAIDVVVSVILIFMLDWRLALAGMVMLPFGLFGPRYLAPRAAEESYRKKEEEARMLSDVQENVSAQTVVKAFSLENASLLAFQRQNEAISKIGRRLGFLTLSLERSSGFSIMILEVLVIALGGYMTFHGSMTIGTFATFQAFFLTLTYSMSYLGQYLPNLAQASGGMRRIETLLTEELRVIDVPDAQALPAFSNEIEFCDVTFSYTGREVSCDRVNLKIPSGSSVAFVGPSGSGKSTLLNLAMRFYDPSSGTVMIDGHDLSHVTQASLRSQLAVVFQESILFNTTIRANIAAGKTGATDEEVFEAAKEAEIHEFIMSLPDRYDTLVGERGGRLSGGQRQRLAIARAMLRKPAILLLDEATSALDSSTEAAINATFERLARGRTVISVTHRLASVVNADQIFVLDAGRLVEQGRHHDLLQTEKVYARMWQQQTGFYSSREGAQAVTPARLRAVPVLEHVDDSVLAELARLFATEHYPEDRVIVHEGDVGDKFYILVRGKVEVTRFSPADNSLHRIAVLQDGEYFGEMALLANKPRNASVRTLSSCVCLSLTRGHFLELMDHLPQLKAHFARIVEMRGAPLT
jgi:ATP-binding cassette subfamily B protein